MNNATQVTVSTFGVIMGLASIEHGIGEVLQGNIAPSGIMFPSWPGSAFFRSVNGEPAMSIVPNLLVTGILASLVSLIFLVLAIKFVQRKHGGQVMMLLSIIMLLVGGGIFPPIIGLMIGALGTRINAPYTRSRTNPLAPAPRCHGSGPCLRAGSRRETSVRAWEVSSSSTFW